MANNPFGQLPMSPAAVSKPPGATKSRKTLTVKPGFNAKPDKNVNHGANTGLMRTSLANPKPGVPTIAPSTAPARAAGFDVRSGMETSMGALADKLHPPGR